MGIPNVVAPRNPGVSSAYGLLVADFKNDYARTFIQKPPDYDLEAMERVYRELEEEALYWLDQEGVPQQGRSLLRSADMRYTHQGFEVATDLKGGSLDEESMEGLLERISPQTQAAIRVLPGTACGGRYPQGVCTRHSGSRQDTPTHGEVRSPRGKRSRSGGRSSSRSKARLMLCDIFDREMLSPDSVVEGPSILEGMDSTVVINPGWQGRIDEYGNCILETFT